MPVNGLERRALLQGALATALFTSAGCAHAADSAAPEKAEAFGAFVREQRAAVRLPALSVGVANRAGIITIAQDGVRQLGLPARVERDDQFHIGSITKSMTATLIARLVDRGLMTWQTTPADLWPEWASEMNGAVAAVSIETILRHRAGLPPMERDEDAGQVPVFAGDPRSNRALFARWLLQRTPASPMGEHVYSNAGYGLAGAMAERAADAGYETLLRREVFAPLDMRRGGFGWPPEGQPHGHRYIDGAFVPHDWSDGYRLQPWIVPAGDICASTADMLAYGRAHMLGAEGGAPALSAATWSKLHDASEGDYALGWNIRSFGFHHLGSAGTFVANLIVAPAADIVVFTAMNAAGLPDGDTFISSVAGRAFRDFRATA